MNTFVCNICGIEFPKNEKANKYKRCVQCHKEKEKERRLLNWKQIEERREKYKERAKVVKKEYRLKNKDKINERNKELRQNKIIEELGIERINKINERWIQFNIDEPGRHITETLSPKQKLKIMKQYNIKV